MPQQIQVGNDILEFPDDMPDDQIKAAIDQEYNTQPQAAPKKEISKAESLLTGISQGGTMNFGDEIIAGLSTPVIYGGSRLAEKAGFDTKGLAQKSFSQTYRDEQQKNQAEVRAAEEANPKTALVGNILGALKTGGRVAATKPGMAATNFLKTGSLPVKAIKAAPIGFATSAISGAGAADSDKIGEEALDTGKTGAVISAALPFAGAAINKAISKPVQTTSDDIKKIASQAYKVAEDKGALWAPTFTDKFLAKADEIIPQTQAGKILAGDSPTTKIVEKLQGIKGRGLDLRSAQEIDEFLGDAIDSLSENGIVTKQGKKVLELQTHLRNLMDDAPDSDILGGKEGVFALKEGRKLWSQAAKLRDVEKIITRAEMTDNPATAIKTGFRNLYLNDARMRGFNKAEKKMIKNAAESGIITDALRSMGSRLIPIVAAGSGGGLPATLAAQVGTMASRGAATKLQLNKATKLANAVANRNAVRVPRPALPGRYPLSVAAPISSYINN